MRKGSGDMTLKAKRRADRRANTLTRMIIRRISVFFRK
jgi:hypothetical protein